MTNLNVEMSVKVFQISIWSCLNLTFLVDNLILLIISWWNQTTFPTLICSNISWSVYDALNNVCWTLKNKLKSISTTSTASTRPNRKNTVIFWRKYFLVILLARLNVPDFTGAMPSRQKKQVFAMCERTTQCNVFVISLFKQKKKEKKWRKRNKKKKRKFLTALIQRNFALRLIFSLWLWLWLWLRLRLWL